MNIIPSNSAEVLYYSLWARAAKLPNHAAVNALMFREPLLILCGADLLPQFQVESARFAPGNIYCLQCGEEHVNFHRQRLLALPHCRNCWLGTEDKFMYQSYRLNYLYEHCKQPLLLELIMANANELLQRALAKAKGQQVSTTTELAAPVKQEDKPEELEQLTSVILDLEAQLRSANPQIESYLTVIHKQMLQYPQLVHLLTDEQMGTVVQGALKHSDTILVKEKVSKEKAAKKNQLALGQDW